ncbi:F-box/FBD/LRR-repeat protein At3g52680, partial [Linum grandiflorum]
GEVEDDSGIRMSDSGIKRTRDSKQNFKIVMPGPPDRISELPDEIIYLILRKLQPHRLAARTSILSRRWLKLWNSYPVVEFDSKQRTNFRSFAAATSKRLNRTVPLLLESFTVSLEHPDNRSQGLYELLSSAYRDRSPLRVVAMLWVRPFVEAGMLLNCSRTKSLHLEGCNLSQADNFRICLENLQELTLDHVRVNKESFFSSCLANAPRLEKLSLSWINDTLDKLSLDISAAPLLQTLCFDGLNCFNLLRVAPSVKFLEIAPSFGLGCSEIEDLISKLPSLVSLRFNMKFIFHNFGDDMLRISAHNLRELTVTHCSTPLQVEIDAPNLVTLTIDIIGLPINYRFVNVPYACRCVVICNMTDVSITTDWFIELRNCLTTLAARFHHLVFKLKFSRLDKAPTFDLSRVGNESSPLVVQHLQFATDLGLEAVDEEKQAYQFFIHPKNPDKQAHQTLILDGLLWTCHPEIVSVAQLPKNPDNVRLFSYIFDQIERSKNLVSCCSNGGCWRHRFKDAKITRGTVENPPKSDKSSISTIFLFCDFSELYIPQPLEIV